MRWLLGFVLLLLALGTLRMVGCGDEGEPLVECRVDQDCPDGVCASGICVECRSEEDCNDQNQCTEDYCDGNSCYWVNIEWSDPPVPCDLNGVPGACFYGGCREDECRRDEDCDDQNECTVDTCSFPDGPYCIEDPWPGHRKWFCDYNGLAGRCEMGECVQDHCAGVNCNDNNPCTRDICDYTDGDCHYDRFSLSGTVCGDEGVCISGACEVNVCLELDCDDDDLCTRDECDPVRQRCVYSSVCPKKECKYASCNPLTGSCSYTNMPNGWACGFVGECRNGVCVEEWF